MALRASCRQGGDYKLYKQESETIGDRTVNVRSQTELGRLMARAEINRLLFRDLIVLGAVMKLRKLFKKAVPFTGFVIAPGCRGTGRQPYCSQPLPHFPASYRDRTTACPLGHEHAFAL